MSNSQLMIWGVINKLDVYGRTISLKSTVCRTSSASAVLDLKRFDNQASSTWSIHKMLNVYQNLKPS